MDGPGKAEGRPRSAFAALAAIAASLVVVIGCGGARTAPTGTGGPSPLGAASSAAATAAVAPSATPVVVSGHVDVGGHKLYYACFGDIADGAPTVILEHGLGGDIGQWADVVPAVSGRTRVCAYDRANIRGSDTVDGTRTVADSVADLHAFLGQVAAPGPWIFVGYSWGGLIDQLYARQHPKDVAGLVLVDSNSPDESATYWKHLTPAQVQEDKAATAGPNSENVDILRSFQLVKAAGPMPDVPLIVVTHTVSDPGEWPAGWDAKTFDGLQAQLQAGLVHLTSKGRQVMADGADHDIPGERPDVISAAILDVIDAVDRP